MRGTAEQESQPGKARRRRGAGIAGVVLGVAALATTLTGCNLPAKPADGLWSAWKAGDKNAAAAHATPAAVAELFESPFLPDFKFQYCLIKGTTTTCRWQDFGFLDLIIDGSINKVVDVHYWQPWESAISGGDEVNVRPEVFSLALAWNKGDTSQYSKWATADALALLPKWGNGWKFHHCLKGPGTTTCTWSAHDIVLQWTVDHQAKKVVKTTSYSTWEPH